MRAIRTVAVPETYRIRTMSRRDVDVAVAWAAREGWNPGVCDAECFYQADPDGFLLAEVRGEPVATISAVAYDYAFGFAGFYIVRPDARGRGYGLPLYRAALARLHGRNVGGDGVVTMVDKYRQTGFRPAYRNIRFAGTGGKARHATVGEVKHRDDLVPLTEVPFADVLSYDARHFPVARETFLRAWLAQPRAIGYAVIAEDELAGFGLVRPCIAGWKIGPLFADGAAQADVLFGALATAMTVAAMTGKMASTTMMAILDVS